MIVRCLRDPLAWMVVALMAAAFGMTSLGPIFAALFPRLDRPLYVQEGFPALLLAHLLLVGAASTIAVLVGVGLGTFVTRPMGTEFRGLVETVAAMGQTFPPVAVLALAVPVMGFGQAPALIALALYGVLPVVQNTIAGLESISVTVAEAARGVGLGPLQVLFRVELPLAAPVILAGVRTSVVIGVGTAAIASTVGAKTLGLPIIIGLNGSNTAYVLQGAVLVGLLAVTLDLAFGRLASRVARWRSA